VAGLFIYVTYKMWERSSQNCWNVGQRCVSCTKLVRSSTSVSSTQKSFYRQSSFPTSNKDFSSYAANSLSKLVTNGIKFYVPWVTSTHPVAGWTFCCLYKSVPVANKFHISFMFILHKILNNTLRKMKNTLLQSLGGKDKH